MRKFLLILFLIAFFLLPILSSSILAVAECGFDESVGAICCPQDRCEGNTYGQRLCEPGEFCCETCSQALPEGSLGREFKLGGRPIAYVFPTLGSLISTLLPNVYIIAGLILFILLLFGGLGIIMGTGNDNPEQANKGKQAVTAAVFGFGLIFASYWIIQIVQWLTGINILNPPLPLAD